MKNEKWENMAHVVDRISDAALERSHSWLRPRKAHLLQGPGGMGSGDVVMSRENFDKGVSEGEKVKTGQSVFVLEKCW